MNFNTIYIATYGQFNRQHFTTYTEHKSIVQNPRYLLFYDLCPLGPFSLARSQLLKGQCIGIVYGRKPCNHP